MEYTLLNAVTSKTTSANQAVVKGLVTITAEIASGKMSDIQDPITVFVNDVPAFRLQQAPYVRSWPSNAVNIKVEGTGFTGNGLTVKITDEA